MERKRGSNHFFLMFNHSSLSVVIIFLYVMTVLCFHLLCQLFFISSHLLWKVYLFMTLSWCEDSWEHVDSLSANNSWLHSSIDSPKHLLPWLHAICIMSCWVGSIPLLISQTCLFERKPFNYQNSVWCNLSDWSLFTRILSTDRVPIILSTVYHVWSKWYHDLAFLGYLYVLN